MTYDKDRYTLRMPRKYTTAIEKEADAIGTTKAAIILRILAKHYGFIEDREERTDQCQQ